MEMDNVEGFMYHALIMSEPDIGCHEALTQV